MARVQEIVEREDDVEKVEVIESGESAEGGESGGRPNTAKISIDTPPSDVVDLDNRGVVLEFADDLDQLVELDEDTVRSLSKPNRDRYHIAYAVAHRKLDLGAANNKTFRVAPGDVAPSERMTIRGGRKDRDYFWKLPSRVAEMVNRGARPCTDPNVKTLGHAEGEAHAIKMGGEIEQVLMEAPKGFSEKYAQDARRKAAQRSNSHQETAYNELEQAGGVPFRPSRKPE